MGTGQPGSGPVLIAADDPAVAAAVRRLVAAAGRAGVAADAETVASCWRSATALVLDPTLAQRLPAGLVRRDRLLVVTGSEPDPAGWRAAVRLGADQLFVLPADETAVLDWLVQVHAPARAGHLVCCVAGRGGAGASTLAAGLALAADGADERAMLIDLDPGSGGLDVLLGAEQQPGARWRDLAATAGVLDGAALTAACPKVRQLPVMSTGGDDGTSLSPAAVDSVLGAALRARSIVVADVGRRLDRAGRDALTRAAQVFVVVTADVRGVAAGTVAVREVARHCPATSVVVRRPGPGDLRPRDVAAAVGAPLAATWRWDRRLGASVDAGRFAQSWRRSTLGRVAEQLAGQLNGEFADGR